MTKESVFKKLSRAVIGKSKVDDEVLDNLEEVLITSDVGVETTRRLLNESRNELLPINTWAHQN
jgi:fused signal recognition particle receptor